MNETNFKKLQDELLIPGLQQSQINLTFTDAIWEYLMLLNKWNKAYNLTAIRQLDEMVVQHVLDGLSVHRYLPEGAFRLIDVGTGGGIPGVLLAITRPEVAVTLLDAVGKKTRFLNQVRRTLKLDNVTVVNDRVENYSPDEKYDVIISRAFSEVNQFLTWTAHLGNGDSHYLAMKGPRDEPLSPGSDFALNAKHDLVVPFLDEQRTLYSYQKIDS